MSTPTKNPWRASIGLSSDHAGINQQLGYLQGQMYHALARINDPRKVRDYVRWIIGASAHWLEVNADQQSEK